MAHLLLDLIGRKSREQNDRKGLAMFAHVIQNVESIDVRHLEIKKEKINAPMLELFQCGFAVARFVDIEPDATQVMRQGEALNG